MVLPDQAKCQRVVAELDGDPALTQWEADFLASNRQRSTFTDAQREVIARLVEKYECD